MLTSHTNETNIYPSLYRYIRFTSVFSFCDIFPLGMYCQIHSELSTIDGPRRTYNNFKKADLARYAEACDKYLAEADETRPVEQAETTFRKAVNKASGLCIQAGRIQHSQPTLPASAKSLANERDRNANKIPPTKRTTI